MLSAICFNLDQSKIVPSGNGLRETSQQDSKHEKNASSRSSKLFLATIPA